MRTSIIVATLLMFSTAVAEETSERFANRPAVISIHAGVGLAAGLLGMEIAYSPTPIFEFALGGGAGLDGPQLAFAGRYQRRGKAWAYQFGLGLSVGKYRPIDFDSSSPPAIWENAVWGNVEVAAVWRSSFGLQFRPSLGLGAILNEDGCRVTPDNEDDGPDDCNQTAILPQLGVSVGYAF